jgi:hypothetical protein
MFEFDPFSLVGEQFNTFFVNKVAAFHELTAASSPPELT